MATELAPLRSVAGADGVPIRVYAAAGDADRAPVVLVHGLGSDASVNWSQAGWVRALQAVGRPLVALDLRGHGASGAPVDPSAYRLPLMVEDLAAVLDATVPTGRTVDAIGYSLGSRVLLEYVGRAGTGTPVRRLVLGGSAGQPLLQGMDPDAVDAAIGGGPVPAHAETARIARTIGALPTNDERALAALVRGLHSDPDAVRRAPDPTVPTMVGVGTADPLHDAAAAWAGSLGAGAFVSLPGRNHVSAVPSGVFRTAAVRFLG
jgi:pimeloyl-ACP methyl ester carboxylesterase